MSKVLIIENCKQCMHFDGNWGIRCFHPKVIKPIKGELVDYVNKNCEYHCGIKVDLKINDLGAKGYGNFKYGSEVLGTLLENSKVNEDVQKINFDYENVGYDGFEILKNNLPVIKGRAGGDWESPVYFIIYHDGKKFRGYTSENGNTFNPITRTASGSEDEGEIEITDHRGDYNPIFLKKLSQD